MDVSLGADALARIPKSETIRIVAHLDCDGICAASLLVHFFSKREQPYSLSVVPHIDEKVVAQLSQEPYKHFIFADLGSGSQQVLSEGLAGRSIIVLDHHDPTEGQGCVHLNPHLQGISSDISGAGVVYLTLKKLDPSMRSMAHLAVIGAIGDAHEPISGLNGQILEDAKAEGTIQQSRCLRLHGHYTKPLTKLLAMSYDMVIPGITGSESAASQMLASLHIPTRGGSRMYHELTEAEHERLAKAVIERRASFDHPEDVYTDYYTLSNEKRGPLKDCREYSTVLNACGRMGKSSAGIGTCLGHEPSKIRAIVQLKEYRKELNAAVSWYEANRHKAMKGQGYIIFDAGRRVPPTIAGTLASMLAHSQEFQKPHFIMTLADMEGGTTKVSLRTLGNLDSIATLRQIVKEGSVGGHAKAAGAIITTSDKRTFIEESVRILSALALEELV